MGARRQRYVDQTKLDANGAGSIAFTFRGDISISRMRVTVVLSSGADPLNQSTALVDINGDQFDGSQTGNNDTSDVDHLALASDVLTCTWAGGDAGAVATFTVWGIEYDTGTGIGAKYGVS